MKENKICFILYTISSILFFLSGAIAITTKGMNGIELTHIGLGICFGSIAYTYYKKYKKEK